MECCVCVSTETVLQIVNQVLHSNEGLQSKISVQKLFSLWCKTYLFVKLLL